LGNIEGGKGSLFFKNLTMKMILPSIKQRKCLLEHPFGTVKRGLGFTYFLTRGTANVRTESLLHFLDYNMKRLINILGIKKLQEVLQT
jgi:hypothetical protein